jgi:hypothetical protein
LNQQTNQAKVAEDKAVSSSSPRIAFMLPSERRPKDSFYAAKTVLSLKHGGVPSSSLLIFNVEGDGNHVELENMYNETLVKEQYSVHWVVRPPGTSFTLPYPTLHAAALYKTPSQIPFPNISWIIDSTIGVNLNCIQCFAITSIEFATGFIILYAIAYHKDQDHLQ